MTAGRWVAVSVVWVGVVGSVGAGAQAVPCTVGVNNYFGYGMSSGGRAAPAFTATAKSTFEQRLVDGNTIHGTSVSHVARDTAGRTRMEMVNGCERGEDGAVHARMSVNIQDPVAKTNLNWQVGAQGEKVARLSYLVVASAPRKALTAEEREASVARARKMREEAARQPEQAEWQTEELGSKSVNGVMAQGVRRTRTIPPGEEGNDMRVVTVVETWTSKEYGVVMAINDDPRRGKSTYELVDMVQAEPDAALFAAPEGYRVEEMKPNGAGARVVTEVR